MSNTFIPVASLIFLICFLGCLFYLWYDNHPAVRMRRELLQVVQDGEEAKQEIWAATKAAKEQMDRIMRRQP
jgi:hypothetical protein